MDVYDEARTPVDLDDAAAGRRPAGSPSTSPRTTDLTAVVAAWPDDEDGYDVWSVVLLPGRQPRARARAGRRAVSRSGRRRASSRRRPATWSTTAPSRRNPRALRERFNVQEIAFDPHLAQAMMAAARRGRLPGRRDAPGVGDDGAGHQGAGARHHRRRLRHGGHPVLRWNFANVAVETDKAGNKTFHKGKSQRPDRRRPGCRDGSRPGARRRAHRRAGRRLHMR